MKTRSRLLFEISRHLASGTDIRTVPELRQLRPDIAAAYPTLGRLDEIEDVLDLLRRGENFSPKSPPRIKTKKISQRDLEIEQMVTSGGRSLAQVGATFGLSRQRILQIVQRVRAFHPVAQSVR